MVCEVGNAVTEQVPADAALTEAGRRNQYVVGVDLGQKRDYTALAVVERSEVLYRERSAVTWAQFARTEYRVRMLERLALGLPYGEIVDAVAATVRGLQDGHGEWSSTVPVSLVVDATGVGTPVCDLLAVLPCTIVPVTITGGTHAAETRYGWSVPKRDLISELQVAYEQNELLVATRTGAAAELVEELGEMRVRVGERGREQYAAWREGAHDDLVLAVSLAVWWARRRARSPWGRVRLF